MSNNNVTTKPALGLKETMRVTCQFKHAYSRLKDI